jgi:alpha/beta superfamily hydrolase
MDDPVVVAICRATDALGAATLRFNFRSVGESEGRFTNGAEEHRDTRAALDVLRRWPGVSGDRVAIAGYSFGAAMILEGFRRLKAAQAVALVAPTVQSVQSKRFQRDERPRLVIAGRDDKLAPSLAIQRELDDARHPPRFEELATADHGMRGHEAEIGRVVADFVTRALG